MNSAQQHISFKCLTLILVMALLLPSAVKLHHTFQDHKHEVCKNNAVEHFHELDLECEFYKFNKQNQLCINYEYDHKPIVSYYKLVSFAYYDYVTIHQQLSFSLRAPPAV